MEEVIEKNNKAYEQLEKENSEIVEELQQWIADGDQRNKTLEEVLEKTNEENCRLLIQISAMKKEMKALESKKVGLQSELAMKRADVKYLKNKVCYGERELRNLKRDLQKEQRNVERTFAQGSRTLAVTQQLKDQFSSSIKEYIRIISEKDRPFNELEKDNLMLFIIFLHVL